MMDVKTKLLLLSSSIVLLYASRLNVPRVLLSYNYEIPSNFTLRVIEGGCYDWRSTRPNEAVVKPLYENDCSTKAIVSAIARSPARQTAIILANDKVSGITLRCDVIIDSISRLEIITTTRELFMEEAPEEFEVRAYDEFGNEFSTLEGLQFEWHLEDVRSTLETLPAHSVLRFIRFTDSPYETPQGIAALEQRGQQGSLVLIEGRSTGLALLKAFIPHPAYQSVPSSSVTLMVIANLLLEPQDVYILPFSVVPYSVFQLKHGVLHPVPLKPSSYYLQVEDSSVGKLLSDGVSVQGVTLGQTKVTLFDRNVEAATNIKQPTANFHVVLPGYLTIEIEPVNKPILIVNRLAAFHVHVFDKHNNRLYLSDNIVVKTTIPSEYFSSEVCTANGTYVGGVARKQGHMTVTAELSHYIIHGRVQDLSPILTASVDVTIYGCIEVTPKWTVLPWYPVSEIQHHLPFTALGGSGHVVWSMNDSSVASVDTSGVVATVGLGSVLITAAMTENLDNNDSGVVIVHEIVGINLLPGFREAFVQDVLELHLTAFTQKNMNKFQDPTKLPDVPNESERLYFTDCHMLPFGVSKLTADFTAKTNARLSSSQGSCAVVDIVGTHAGFTSVHIAYTTVSGRKLSVSTTVAAAYPLLLTAPDSGELVLPENTGGQLLFEGGPLPWIHKPASHYARISVSGEAMRASIYSQEPAQGRYLVAVECLTLGESLVTLTVGNNPSTSLPLPRESIATARVLCARPDALHLRPVPSPLPHCPLHHLMVSSVAAPAAVAVLLTDSEGRLLSNVSSLHFTWSSSSDVVSLPIDGPLMTGLMQPPVDYGLVLPLGIATDVTITVSLPYAGLSSSLVMRLVHAPLLIPPQLVLWHHPNSAGNFSILDGSGHFELQHSPQDIAQFAFYADNSSVGVNALTPGVCTLEVVDLCLVSEQPTVALAEVRVASVHSVSLEVYPLLCVGEDVEAVLRLLDADGLLLPVHKPDIVSASLTVKDVSVASVSFLRVGEAGELLFRVEGSKAGETLLRGKITLLPVHGSASFLSEYQVLQVYPPLLLQPSSLILMVGAYYQVSASGGPAQLSQTATASNIEFYGNDSTVCAVTAESGLVQATSLGNCSVEARLTVTLPAKTASIKQRTVTLHSKNTALVRVVTLDSIFLWSPTHTLLAGTSMPLHLAATAGLTEGTESITPLSFSSADPPLIVSWSVSDPLVATITRPLDALNVESSAINDVMVQLLALQPGNATVTATVRPGQLVTEVQRQQLLHNKQFTAKLKLQVLKSLAFESPSSEHTRLLLSPGAHYTLFTNRDGEAAHNYTVQANQCSEHTECEVASVTSEGVVSGNKPGDVTILVAARESQSKVTQRAAVLVEVKEVCYIQRRLVTQLPVSGKLTGAPLGAEMSFSITFHDDVGRIFDAVAPPQSLTLTPNRRDLLSIKSNDSALQLSAVLSGYTVVEVLYTPSTTPCCSSSTALRHYLSLRATSALRPELSCAVVGFPMCLDSAVGSGGRWSSAEVAVERHSGVLVPLLPGPATVSYAVMPGVHLLTHFSVVSITQVVLSAAAGAVLSDNSAGQEMLLPIDVRSEACHQLVDSCRPQSLPSLFLLEHLRCEATHNLQNHVPSLISVYSLYSAESGYACAVRLTEEPLPWLLEEYKQNSDLVVTFRVAYVGVTSVRSEEVVVPLVPAVRLNGSTEIFLSNTSPSDESLSVIGPTLALDALKVKSNSSSVGVSLTSSASASVFHRTVVVQASEEVWGAQNGTTSTVLLTITSPVTKQTLQVKVHLTQVGEGWCSSHPPTPVTVWEVILSVLLANESLFFTLLCIALTVAALAVGYQTLRGPIYRQTKEPVFAQSPAPTPPPTTVAGGQSPSRSNLSLWSSDSVYGAPHVTPSPARLRNTSQHSFSC